MKVKLQEYALMAEIIGALAVVVSLIYVGIGVRQNTDAVQIANHQALVTMDVNKNTWLKDVAFATTYLNAQQDITKLSPAEQLQVTVFVAEHLTAWEFAFVTHENGAIEENVWIGLDRFYREQIKTNSFQIFWNSGQGATFSVEFESYVDSLFTQPNPQ